jgi:enterochelin esterase family protein
MLLQLNPPAWATHFVSDLTDWRQRPVPVADLGPLTLPDDAYLEYAWLDAAGQVRPDPDDPERAQNLWFTANSRHGPQYLPDPLAASREPVPAGHLQRLHLQSAVLGQRRHLALYTPAGQGDARLPVVYVQDGTAFHHVGHANRLLERLLGQGRARPAHLAYVEPVAREREYFFNEAYERFWLEEALPAVEARLACDGERLALGASLGGLVSAWVAWRHPELFGTVAAVSGAFLYGPGDSLATLGQGSEWLLEQVRTQPPRSLRFSLACGTLEWLNAPNRRLAAALRDKGYAVRYSERNAGHNWVNWHDSLAGVLEFALSINHPGG